MVDKKRRKIDLEKAREVVARLNEVPSPIISCRQFVIMHFDELQQSGKSLDALHHFFLANGIDVSSFESFRTIYNSVKRSRKNSRSSAVPERKIEPDNAVPAEAGRTESPQPEIIPEPEKTVPANTVNTDKPQGTETEKTRQRGLGLRPIILPDGTEVEIDKETGAKFFKI